MSQIQLMLSTVKIIIIISLINYPPKYKTWSNKKNTNKIHIQFYNINNFHVKPELWKAFGNQNTATLIQMIATTALRWSTTVKRYPSIPFVIPLWEPFSVPSAFRIIFFLQPNESQLYVHISASILMENTIGRYSFDSCIRGASVHIQMNQNILHLWMIWKTIYMDIHNSLFIIVTVCIYTLTLWIW